jgi:hypothetical protein
MLLPLSLLACAQEQPQQAAASNSQHASAEAMEISRAATRQAIRGPENWFTGTATITPLFDPKGLSQVGRLWCASNPVPGPRGTFIPWASA